MGASDGNDRHWTGRSMKNYTTEQVIASLQRQVDACGLRATAREYEVDAAFLCRVLSGKQPMTVNLGEAFGFVKMPDSWTRKP